MSIEPNPYAPPRASGRRKRAAAAAPHAPGEWVKWVYGALALARALSYFAIVSGVAQEAGLQKELIAAVDGPLLWSLLLLAPLWCYFAWSGIPRDYRAGVTPESAAVRFFVPLYSLFWVFAVNLQLGNAINAVLTQSGDDRRAPKWIAVAATVVYFVPVLMLLGDAKSFAFLVQLVDHAMWLVYMIKCDVLRRAVIAVVRKW
jgi:hypothetical protein